MRDPGLLRVLAATAAAAGLAIAWSAPGAAHATGDAGLLAGDPERGAAVFRGPGRCVECHRYRGEGSFVRGPSLDAHWRDGPELGERLPERPRPEGYEEQVPGDAFLLQSLLEPEAYLLEGEPPSMPPAAGPLQRLSRQDLADLLAWLNPAPDGTLRWVPELPPPGPDPWDALPPGDAERGEAWFFRPDDSSCAGCHIVRAPHLEERFHPPFWSGGSLAGPELTRTALLATPAQVLEAIVQPGAAWTPGFQEHLAETEGERLLTGILLAQGEDGVLLLDASPTGPEYSWIDAEDLAEVTPEPRSRMTHVFAELLDPQQRLDVLAFLRVAALESVDRGEDGNPGRAWGARDPVASLYDGRWPAAARPELLQRLPGLIVDSESLPVAIPPEESPQ